MIARKLFANLSLLHAKRKIRTQSNGINATNPRRIFSGIQPTGSIHLGNYLGAIKHWEKLQNENSDIMYSIVDLHSITLPQDPKQLFHNVLEITAALLACGINPDKSTLFQQSTVPQHTELCWQLGCLTTMARLAHLPQYKEKSASLKDIPLGLFVYPVLQAADVLIYKATDVPVGEDQVQHVQLIQDVAKMFNSRYGQTFPIPHSLVIDNDVCRLKSLRDPTKKMSKSDSDPKSRINLTDSPDEIVKKFKKAITDFTSEVYYDPANRPGVSNLLSIHSALTGKSIEDICAETRSIDTGKYKMVVAESAVQVLTPIQAEFKRLMNSPEYIMNVLQKGTEKAGKLAEMTMEEVRMNLGLRLRGNKLNKERLQV